MKKDAIKLFFEEEAGISVRKEIPKAKVKIEKSNEPKPKFFVRLFDGIVKLSILMIFFGLPLFFTNLTFQGVAFEKQIYFYFFILLGLVAWVSKGLIAESIKIRRTPLDIPIITFWLVSLLATIFSVDRWHSFIGFFGDPSRGFMGITALILFYYLFLSNFSQKMLKWSLIAIISSGSILTIWTILVVLKVSFIQSGFAALIPTNLFGSVISLGIFISSMMPLLIMVIFKIRTGDGMNDFLRFIATVFLFAILIANLFLLWTLYSVNVPWIGVFVGMIFFLIFVLSKIIHPQISWSWLPMAVFVVLMVIPLVVPVDAERLELSSGTSWEITKNSLKDNFILGSGPATFGYDFSLHRPEEFNLTSFSNQRFYRGTGILHEAVPTLGVLGALPLIVIILSFVSLAVYFLLKDREKNKIYSLGLLSSTFIILIDAMYIGFEGPIFLVGVTIGTLALATIFHESDAEEKNISLAIKASPKYALTLAFLFMIVTAGVIFLFIFIGKSYIADVYASQGVKERSVQKFEKAISFFDKEGRYYTRLGQEYMILVNREILKGSEARNINLVQENLNKAIENSKKGADLMKNDVQAIEVLAQIYENTGMITKNYKLAEEIYQKATELEPNNPVFYLKLGQIKLNLAVAKKGDSSGSIAENEESSQLIREAEDLFKKSIEKKENFSEGYYQLALAQEALGEINGAIENMQRAARFGRNVNNVFALGRLHQARGDERDNDLAEAYFREILGVNDKEINTHFSLGILYEKTGKNNQAVDEYRKVLELLPGDVQETKDRVERMINNIQTGIENIPENLNSPADEQEEINEENNDSEESTLNDEDENIVVSEDEITDGLISDEEDSTQSE